MKNFKSTYLNEIVYALEQLGGAASLKEIINVIESNRSLSAISTNPNWSDNVRSVIQRHCSTTKSYTGAEDLFYSVYGLGEGYWGLNAYREKVSNAEINPIEHRQIELVENDIKLSNTEKEQIVLARRGQGIFRRQLIEKYKTCIVTNIENPDLLIASHIRPWRNATAKERISVNNGFLLSSLYDRLFDSGLITFKTDGHILVSSDLSEHDRAIVNIDSSRRYLFDISDELKENIQYHNDAVFRG